MNYITENGIILSNTRDIIHFTRGNPSHVDFPHDVILSLHKNNPGYIYSFIHSHPPEMRELSERDKQFIKTWARTLFPFPVRLATLTEEGGLFILTMYLGILESKEEFINRGGQKGEMRQFDIIEEEGRIIDLDFDQLTKWEELLIYKSYSK